MYIYIPQLKIYKHSNTISNASFRSSDFEMLLKMYLSITNKNCYDQQLNKEQLISSFNEVRGRLDSAKLTTATRRNEKKKSKLHGAIFIYCF